MCAILGISLCVLALCHVISADPCPCVHCGPPMCKNVCAQDCVKCCTCCVFFENRVGKRAPQPGHVAHSGGCSHRNQYTSLAEDPFATRLEAEAVGLDDASEPALSTMELLEQSRDNLNHLRETRGDQGKNRLMALLKLSRKLPM